MVGICVSLFPSVVLPLRASAEPRHYIRKFRRSLGQFQSSVLCGLFGLWAANGSIELLVPVIASPEQVTRREVFFASLPCYGYTFSTRPAMSLASVHHLEMHGGLAHRSPSIGSLGSSLEELRNYFNNSDTVLSIEELRLQINSCFTCGVSWHKDHVSLDCRECGGYSLQRPCPLCDGRCNAVWKRDLTMSHATGKARWQGECAQRCKTEPSLFKTISADEESRLCGRLEKLGASS